MSTDLLQPGNSKLGKSIWQWSIPAGSTCPGRTHLCDTQCYAQAGFFRMRNVKESLQANYEASLQDDFIHRIRHTLVKRGITRLRVHVAGDFYNVGYIRKWRDIIAASQQVRVFTYTRSWRLPELREELGRFAKDCRNLRMHWSLDRETGFPAKVPRHVRTCYMSVAPDDLPDSKVNLVFRDSPLRDSVVKRMNGVLVCPPENGVNDMTCEKCGVCWGDKVPANAGGQRIRGRVALPVL